VDIGRVVQTWAPWNGRAATGHLIADLLVLTAWHAIVGPDDARLEVRLFDEHGRSGWMAAKRIWPSEAPDIAAHPERDVALLEITDTGWLVRELTPMRWGRIAGAENVPCRAVGFPKAQVRPDARREMKDINGFIERYTGLGSGLLSVMVTNSVPVRGDGWAGGSGAGLYVGPLLVGILVEDRRSAYGGDHLRAVSLADLAQDTDLAATLRQAGVVVEFEDAIGHSPSVAGPSLPLPGQVPVPNQLSNLPRRGLFVGRNAELEALDEVLAAGFGGLTQTVSGLGGIGKTALAAEFAYTRAARFAGVWWVNADSRATIHAGMVGLAGRLCPGRVAGHEQSSLVDWAIGWLQGHPGLLLVWDDVEDLEEVGPLLAQLPGTRHLLTSRRRTGWHAIGVAAPIPLGALGVGESEQLLTALAGPELVGRDGATLCRALGFLPLAIEQVGAYLAEAGISAADYLRIWNSDQAKAVAAACEASRSERIMTGVWRITLDKLDDTPEAGHLLRIMAWLAPDGIPRALLNGFDDTSLITEALRRLNAYSMIALHADQTMSVHRVVQAVARAADKDDPHRRPGDIDTAWQVAIVMLADAIPDNDAPISEAIAAWKVLLPHVDAVAASSAGRQLPEYTAEIMDMAFEFLRQQGNLAAGIRIAACSLAGEEQRNGYDHQDTLTSRNCLARAYEAAGDLLQALALYEQNLADRTRVLGPDHPDTLSSRNDLAGAFESAGNLAKAIPLYEQNLADSLRMLGPDHADTLSFQNNLAFAYKQAGNLTKAIPLYEQNLADSLRVLGPDHPLTLASPNNLAGAYRQAGNLATAIPIYEQNLADRIRVLGPDHPSTLCSRNNLAYAYELAGEMGEATALYEQNLADSLRVLGPDHPDTLSSRNNLAHAYESAREMGQAIPLYEQVLVDRSRVLGPNHPDTLDSQSNLAEIYFAAGSRDRAIPLFEQTLADHVRVLGPDHPQTMTVRTSLAAVKHPWRSSLRWLLTLGRQ
jgi:tetratricopeptide (TPR) repeat protein